MSVRYPDPLHTRHQQCARKGKVSAGTCWVSITGILVAACSCVCADQSADSRRGIARLTSSVHIVGRLQGTRERRQRPRNSIQCHFQCPAQWQIRTPMHCKRALLRPGRTISFRPPSLSYIARGQKTWEGRICRGQWAELASAIESGSRPMFVGLGTAGPPRRQAGARARGLEFRRLACLVALRPAASDHAEHLGCTP